MLSFVISLSSMEAVRRFVGITGKYPVDVDLVSGRYTVDGKSIMGIFSLKLDKPVSVQIYEDAHPAQAKELAAELEEFRV